MIKGGRQEPPFTIDSPNSVFGGEVSRSALVNVEVIVYHVLIYILDVARGALNAHVIATNSVS